MVQKQNGDIFWNGIEVNNLGDNKKQFGDVYKEYDFNENVQDGTLNKTLLKNLNGKDTFTLNLMLETLDFRG